MFSLKEKCFTNLNTHIHEETFDKWYGAVLEHPVRHASPAMFAQGVVKVLKFQIFSSEEQQKSVKIPLLFVSTSITTIGVTLSVSTEWPLIFTNENSFSRRFSTGITSEFHRLWINIY